MKHEFWTIAYRTRGEKTILEDTSRPFRVIPNTWRYWAADPHLFEHKGKTWVFAELYDRVLRQGVIGCCCLSENGPTKWKVALKMPFHLSYPHIFHKEDEIYMIPESYVGDEIALYKAVEFPYRWKRVKAIQERICAVDTTRIPWNGDTWLLAQESIDNRERLILMTENGEKRWIVTDDGSLTRPAGPVFHHDGALLRPSQNCSAGYGCALRFNRIETVSNGIYQERLFMEIKPEQICSDLKFAAEGIHTYGCNDHYEIIDLKGYEADPLFTIMRPIWYIWRRVKRVLHL